MELRYGGPIRRVRPDHVDEAEDAPFTEEAAGLPEGPIEGESVEDALGDDCVVDTGADLERLVPGIDPGDRRERPEEDRVRLESRHGIARCGQAAGRRPRAGADLEDFRRGRGKPGEQEPRRFDSSGVKIPVPQLRHRMVESAPHAGGS